MPVVAEGLVGGGVLTVSLCDSQDCMIGVVFSDESEAKTFYKKVTTKKTTSCALFPISSR